MSPVAALHGNHGACGNNIVCTFDALIESLNLENNKFDASKVQISQIVGDILYNIIVQDRYIYILYTIT